MKNYLRKTATAMALLGMLTVSLPINAAVMETEAAVLQELPPMIQEQQRQDVMQFMGRADVKRQLQVLGVSPQQALARVDALSEAEIAQLHADLPSAAAGGSDILGVLVFLFVVLLVTDLLGLTKVFPFTRSR